LLAPFWKKMISMASSDTNTIVVNPIFIQDEKNLLSQDEFSFLLFSIALSTIAPTTSLGAALALTSAVT